MTPREPKRTDKSALPQCVCVCVCVCIVGERRGRMFRREAMGLWERRYRVDAPGTEERD